MKNLLKYLLSISVITSSATSVVACGGGGSDSANTITIYADGANDEKALQLIGDNFVKEFGLDGKIKIKSIAVDMKNTASKMISSPKQVHTDLYNMPHDYISQLHGPKVMTNLDDIKFDAANLGKDDVNLGLKISGGKLMSANGKEMAIEWPDFLSRMKDDWKNGGKIYGEPVNADAIDEIAIIDKVSGNDKRYDYILPSTFQTNLTEYNDEYVNKLDDTNKMKNTLKEGNYDLKDLIRETISSGDNDDKQSKRTYKNEYVFNDFGGDFVTSAMLRELPESFFGDKKDGNDFDGILNGYKMEDIKMINQHSVAFPDPKDPTKTDPNIKKAYIEHWTQWFNWLKDNYYKSQKAGGYESNGKILKGVMAEGNLFAWNTATWDMAGASKEFSPGGSLVGESNNVKLRFGAPIKWDKNDKTATPLLMAGGFGVYGLSKHKALSMALLEYIAKKENSYSWLRQSRGMMFDKSAIAKVTKEVQAILDDNSLNDKQRDKKVNDYFKPDSLDSPYVDADYAKIWLQGMEQSAENAKLGLIAAPAIGWGAFLGVYATVMSSLRDKGNTQQLDSFNSSHEAERLAKALGREK